MIKEIDTLLIELEREELEADDGVGSSQTYLQLLAIYLLKNELCYAKYLWKRIPKSLKNNSNDIKNIWIVAEKMWQRDWPAVHNALNVEWNKNISDIMSALKDSIKERAMTLVGDAYSSMENKLLAEMIGMSVEDSRQEAFQRGWTATGSIINPEKINPHNIILQETTEEQLYKLTQFVSFLEN